MGPYELTTAQIARRLFVTCWIVYVLHFATNIVREMLPVGSWSGKAMSLQLARTSVMRPETEAAIILLQEGKAGPIIGAAWTGLW